MATAMNYAKTYSDTLAEAWPYVLYFGALYATPNNGRYRFNGAKSIEIPRITVGGRVASVRDAMGIPDRNFENEWETKTLTNQRQWSTLIHPKDIDQTNMAMTLANITSVFNNEHKFPEMDAYCISKIYSDWIGFDQSPRMATLSTSNVLSHFDSMMAEMTENGVPTTGRYLYVTPAVMSLFKSVSVLNRNLNLTRETGNLSRVVTVLDGVTVIEVPSKLMKTKYTFTEGYAVANDAEQIQMLLIHPESVITPISYQFAQLDEPSAVSGGKYVYFEESFEDVFVLQKRCCGISFLIGD